MIADYHTAVGNHMSYGITQCYFPAGSGDFPSFTPDEAGTLDLATLEECTAELTRVVVIFQLVYP